MAQANNYFSVSGNLVRDPEIRLTTRSTKYSFVSIAVNGISKDKVDFLSICFWEKLAENIKAYCHKGDCLTICGHISTFKKDNKTELQLVADGFTILRSNKKAEEPAPAPEVPAATEAPAATPTAATKPPVYGDVFAEMSEPFTPFS